MSTITQAAGQIPQTARDNNTMKAQGALHETSNAAATQRTVAHLDHLNMTVADLAESVGWYHRVFGFQTVESGWYEGHPWAIVKAGEAMLCMYERPRHKRPDRETYEAQDVHGVSHFALRVDDVAQWRQTLQHENLRTYWDSPVQWPNSTSWYVRDPSGYEIEVVAWDRNEVTFG